LIFQPDQPGHGAGPDDDWDMSKMDFCVEDEFKDLLDSDLGEFGGGMTSAALPSAGPNKGGNNVFFFGPDTSGTSLDNH
jgi:hypothetical protein